MNFDDDIMHQVWNNEQEILDVFHAICKKNHLRYSLFYGTLLGAVRHKGFIPWDDDIDIMMPRRDYNKLISIWEKEAPEGYLLQMPGKDNDYTNNFVKIRKDHTTFLQTEEEAEHKYHKGIFIDIFPADRVPKNHLLRKVQYVFAAINLLYTRGYTSGSKGIIGITERILLRVPKKAYPVLRDFFDRKVQIWNCNKNFDYFCKGTIRACKVYYPSNMFSKLKLVEFNGKKYYSVNDADAVLTVCYGDYMQLPPVEERVWFHHPVLVDFEHNYEELK